jgi:protein tyrosine/serine phosphatase
MGLPNDRQDSYEPVESRMKNRSRKASFSGLCLFIASFFAAGPAAQALPDGESSKGSPAQRIVNPHLSNFHKISDNLYRGAQPSQEGMKELERLGIRTVINLREWHSDRKILKGTSLRYKRIKMDAMAPSDKQAIRFLQIVSRRENGPFFVHCQHGADRTGTMCALYRTAFQGWTKSEAIDEMTQGEFGFHKLWKNTLLPYLRQVDVEALKEKAGL